MSTIVQTSYQYPESVTSGNDTGNSWENPTNILLPDDACATANANQASDITVGNFSGIALPEDAVITGIKFQVRAKGQGTMTFYTVIIDQDTGAETLVPYTAPFSGITPDLTYYEFGGINYLFGIVWTPDMINNFRLRTFGQGDVQIDVVAADVYYYVPSISPEPTPPSDNCIDCNSPIQAQPFYLALPMKSDDRYAYLQSFNYPNGEPIQFADLGSCGGAIDLVFDEGKPKGNGENFEENARTGVWEILANGTVRIDFVNPATFRGLDFKTPYGPVTDNRSPHAANSKVIISNNGPFYDRFLRKCQIGVLVSDIIAVEDEGVEIATPVTRFNFIGPSVQAEQDNADPLKVNITIVTNPTNVTPVIEDSGTATTGVTQQNSLTFPATVTDSNYLRVYISTEDTIISSVTFNAIAMTLVGSADNGGGNLKAAIYELINPAPGTHNVVISMAVPSVITGAWKAWLDVDTSETADVAIGSSALPSVATTTTVENEILDDVVGTIVDPMIFVHDLWVIDAEIDTGTSRQLATSSRKILAPANITDSYAITPSSQWAIVVAGIKGTASPFGGVQSVTGEGINNTDPANPILSNNMNATTNPTVTNDNTEGYVQGNVWFNNTNQTLWIAQSVATGAAVWTQATGAASTPLTVQLNGVDVETNVDTINVTGNANVTTPSSGQVDINILAGSGSGGTKLTIDTTQVTTPGDNAENDIYTVNIPGGTLGDNDAIRFKILFSSVTIHNSPDETKQFRLRYGGTEIALVTLDIGNVVSNAIFDSIILQGYIIADNATGAQKGHIELVAGNGVLNDGNVGGGLVIAQAEFGVSAIDSTVDQDLVVSVQSNLNDGNATVIAEAIIVEKISDSGNGDKKVGVGEISDTTWYNIQLPFSMVNSTDPRGNVWNTNSGTVMPSQVLLADQEFIAVSVDQNGFLPNFRDVTGNPLKYNSGIQAIFSSVALTVSNVSSRCGLGFGIITANESLNIENLQGTNTLSVGFVRDSAGQWFARTATGAGHTETAITVADGTHVFRCEYDPGNGTPQARYYVDGILLATITTNIPSAINTIIGWSGGNGENAGDEGIRTLGVPAFAIEI